MSKIGFQIGDIVKLKSGGPEMTVSEVFTPSLEKEIKCRCQWFGGKKLEGGIFPPNSLVLAKINGEIDNAKK